jgi:hypothetical protein
MLFMETFPERMIPSRSTEEKPATSYRFPRAVLLSGVPIDSVRPKFTNIVTGMSSL